MAMGKAEELAAVVEGLGNRKRRQYPKELQRQIAEHVREQRDADVPMKTISQRLGIKPTLLRRWELGLEGAFRRVELSPQMAGKDPWVLHAPCGVRVEGLTLEELVLVLRGLQ
jgi:hypothetical protein